MQRAAPERLEFAPPPNKASLHALALALVVHLLLIVALTWGISWKYSDEGGTSFEAELWSASAQQAAPEAPPETKPALATHDADIALELEKKRPPAKKPPEKLPEKPPEKPPEKQHADLQAEQKRQAKALEKENLAAAADAEKRHREDVKRIIGMAGSGSGTGSNSGSGSGVSKGPSAGYASKVKARVLPNVVFTDEITGNPTAEVEVSTMPDGTIMSQRLIKSSGNKDWDEAVIKAIIRTGSLPRDVDGRIPSPMTIIFQPRN